MCSVRYKWYTYHATRRPVILTLPKKATTAHSAIIPARNDAQHSPRACPVSPPGMVGSLDRLATRLLSRLLSGLFELQEAHVGLRTFDLACLTSVEAFALSGLRVTGCAVGAASVVSDPRLSNPEPRVQ